MDEINEAKDGVCILSFDNGGPGTYSQLLILKEYMSRLASDLNIDEDEVYPADYFDLMGGVGFGGLVSFMLGHLRMNVDTAIEELLSITDLLDFDGSNGDRDRESNLTILRETLENMLQARGIAAGTKMNELNSLSKRSKVALYAASSTDITYARAFRTYSSRGSTLNPTISEALCATMAIQSHFLPVKIGSRRTQESFVGGPLGANNPTRLLLEEAGMIFGKNRRVALILSLGCGLPRVLSVNSSDTTDVGRLLKEVATDCETVANELSTRLFSIDAYLRLNVKRGIECLKMKDWNSLGPIGTHTAIFLATLAVSESIDKSLRLLQTRIGSVTLEQLTRSSAIKSMAKQAPPVSPYFVLREKPWKKMVYHLVTSTTTHQKILPITGMGGCGKTQLVSYFLQEYGTSYAQTVYVDASSSSSIKSDFQTWSRAFGNGHECDVWEDAFRILSSAPPGERWILILDNVDPDLSINWFLPRNINTTILITSRNRDLGNLSTTIHLELGEMTRDEALLAMIQAARRRLPLSEEEMDSVRIILKELGYLAVALVQAGTYCHQLSSTVGGVFHPYTFTQYLCLFRSHRASLMKKAEPASLDNYRQGVYTTIDLSDKVLKQGDRAFLHLISFFHHAEIPLAAFSWAARHAFQDPGEYHLRDENHASTISHLHAILCEDMEWNELRIQEIIQTLRSFSLVMTSSSDTSFFLHLHPIVQAWSRDMDPVAAQQYQKMAIQVATTCGGVENFKLNRLLLPHILDILKHVDSKKLHANDLVAFSQTLRQQGHFQKAGRLLETALELMKGSIQANTIMIPEVTLQLALSYSEQGRWSEAEKLQTDVVERRTLILGVYHPDTMRAAGHLAETYYCEGKWTEAERLNLEVLAQRRQILGVENPDTIRVSANLAATYHCQGRWTECENLFVQVFEQRKRILGMEHPDTILTAANLAATYHSQGRWNESEKLLLDVLEQRRRILGVEHPDTIFAAAEMASIYCSQGRWSESEMLFIDVLEQRRRILGTEHPDTIKATAKLAGVYYFQGRWKESETLSVEVLQQRRRILGPEHPETISAVASLASTYQGQGRWKESEKLFVEVLEQRRRMLGIEHPDTIRAAAELAATYHVQGRLPESQKLSVEVFEQRGRILGTEHPDTLDAAACLAATYSSQGRWGEAEMLEREALERRRRILGVEHPDTIRSAACLASTYRNQGRLAEAEKLEQEVLERRRRILGVEHPDTIAAVASLAWTYWSQGRWAESEKLEVEVLEQRRRILGFEHPDTINAAANLASTYHSQWRWADSETLDVEVLEQRKRILGVAHPDTILAAANLAATYNAQRRWDEAAALLTPAVQLGIKVLGQQHHHTQEDLRTLASLYDKLGKTREAEETRDLLIPEVPPTADHYSTDIGLTQLSLGPMI